MSLYDRLIRPLFFRLDPETAHHVALQSLLLAGRIPLGLRSLDRFFDHHDPRLETELFGLHFRTPLGLAAGYDKDAVAMRELAALGFGHLEVGTVTVMPQAGHPRPRVFRLPEERAIINRMGFPNEGVEKMISRLKRTRQRDPGVPVGVNIGKGLHTPLDAAVQDYSHLLRQLHPYADFIVVNISSPNTPGLRELQAKSALRDLLGELVALWRLACPDKPLLVKISPDLAFSEVDDVLDVMTSLGMSGVVATNTSTERRGLARRRASRPEEGGLSGPPLRQRSTEIIRYIYRQTAGSLPIIGVGGVDSAEAALEKIRAGASLVQIFTGLIYRGPGLVRSINRDLAWMVSDLGVGSLAELVGQDSAPGLSPRRPLTPSPVPAPLPAHPVLAYPQFAPAPRQHVRE